MEKLIDNLSFIKDTNSDLYSKFFLRFNFLNSGDSYIQNVGTGSGVISGQIIPSLYNFWKTSGKGFFSGNYVKLNNINNYIDLHDCGFIFDYEKLQIGSHTFISNISTGNITQYNSDGNTYQLNVKQGFEFGITANNNLYFEYFTPSGPKVFIHENNLSDKSSVFLNISKNNVSIGNFNFIEDTINFSNFSIVSNNLYYPNNLYIGYNPESNNLYNNNQPFLGNLNNFIILSRSLVTDDIKYINSGFIYDTYISGNDITSGVFSGVTGFSYQVTGTGLIITGYQKTPTGVIYDPWGFELIGYSMSPLYDQVELFGNIPLSGEYVEYYSGTPTIYFIKNNINYLNYNKDVIKFLSEKTNEDLINICLITGNNNFINNKNLFLEQKNKYDYGFYLNNKNLNVNDSFSVFVNGQLQTSGEIINLENQYDSDLERIIRNDYGINNGLIVFYNIYDNSFDSIFLDIHTGNIDCIENFYVNQNIVYLNSVNNRDIFFNGQKLTSGIHFNQDSMGVVSISGSNFLFTGTTGNLCFIPKNYDYFNIYTGTSFINLKEKFYENSSEIYVNGIRQTNLLDYLELSKFNIKTGLLFLEDFKDLIYNN